MGARLLVIGIDGADGRFLARAADDPAFPHLSALRRRGGVRRLGSTPAPTDDLLWASFHYAVEPGEHGRYHYWQRLENGRFGWAYTDEGDRETFWDRLSDNGRRVAVLDVPKCRAPRPLNGIHLADWLVHGRTFPQPVSYPPGLAADIVARFGAAPPSRCGYEQEELGDHDIRAALGQLRRSVGMKAAAALHYLRHEPWDMFAVVFKELHCCSHSHWDMIDPLHPDHDPARAARLGDPARLILGDIDRAVGDLVAEAGADAQVVLFSTTDMQPNGSSQHLMPALVVALNKALEQPDDAGAEFSGWRCQMLAYNENAGALRIAHEPRLAKGQLPRPDAAQSVRIALEGLLEGLRDGDGGGRVVASISHPSGEARGARAGALPDLLIQWRDGAFPKVVTSPLLGRIEAECPRMRPGNHASGGVLLTAGQAACAAARDVSTLADLGAMVEKLALS